MSVNINNGPIIEIRINTSVFTQVQVFPKDSVTLGVGDSTYHSQIDLENPIFNAVKVYASKRTWTANFLEVSSVAKAMVDLLSSGANWVFFRQAEIDGGEIVLYSYRSKIINIFLSVTNQEIKTWFKNKKYITTEADRMPAPEKTIEPSLLGSRETRAKIDHYVRIAIIATVLCIPLCGGLLGGDCLWDRC